MPRLENLNLFASHYQIDVSWVVVVGGSTMHRTTTMRNYGTVPPALLLMPFDVYMRIYIYQLKISITLHSSCCHAVSLPKFPVLRSPLHISIHREKGRETPESPLRNHFSTRWVARVRQLYQTFFLGDVSDARKMGQGNDGCQRFFS